MDVCIYSYKYYLKQPKVGVESTWVAYRIWGLKDREHDRIKSLFFLLMQQETSGKAQLLPPSHCSLQAQYATHDSVIGRVYQ